MSLYISGDVSWAENVFVFCFFLGVNFPQPPRYQYRQEKFTFSIRKTEKFSAKTIIKRAATGIPSVND